MIEWISGMIYIGIYDEARLKRAKKHMEWGADVTLHENGQAVPLSQKH